MSDQQQAKPDGPVANGQADPAANGDAPKPSGMRSSSPIFDSNA